MTEILTAEHDITYTYTRSTGPVIGALPDRSTGPQDHRGRAGSDGRVLVPAIDYDPVTSEDLTELVEVADSGVVSTWSWNDVPLEGQPLDHPFAWALVTLDGADTAMLAAVDAGSEGAISTGARVTARWADERVGSIRDLVCFDLQGDPA